MGGLNMSKTVLVQLRVTPDIKEALSRLGEQYRASNSAVVRHLIINEYVRLNPDKQPIPDRPHTVHQ